MAEINTRHHVTAILVAHDGETWIPKVVAALASQSYPIDNAIAIDTESHDNSLKLLRSSDFKTFSMPRGTGFGDAINEALSKTPRVKQRSADEKIVEWLWFIHDDSAPAKSALAELIHAVDERPNVAVAGPKILGWYDRSHILEMGVSIAPNGARWTGMEYREQDQGQHDGIREVLAVNTAGALVRREVYEEIGGLDPNLSLFRDDVDFGWRVRTAGHSVIAVSDALLYHAEAASSERRSVDVSEAFLRRPLLLDRRNAAYVLLANASWWWLPLITVQLLFSAVARSIGYLVAKLPGYAADEVAAVGLLFIKPTLIFDARKKRRKVRLLSSRIIAEFIPPRGSQISLALDRARAAISRYFDRRSAQTGWIKGEADDQEELTLPTINLGKEDISSDESDELFTDDEQFAKLKSFFSRPIYIFTGALIVLTLIASRNRLGDIAGGALSPVPASGVDLLRKYTESWHTVGQGSSASASPWIFMLGVASLLTLGNLKFFFTTLFLIAVPLVFVLTYKFARRYTKNRVIALSGAGLFALSPAILNSIHVGTFGTLVVAVLIPFYCGTLVQRSITEITWPRVFFLALCDSLIFFFSPLLFLTVVFWQSIKAFPYVYQLIRAREFVARKFFTQEGARFISLLGAPLLVGFPWSATLLRHPSRFLIEPGLQVASDNYLKILLGNPGGILGLPIWIISPALVISLVALFSSVTRVYGELSLTCYSVAILATLFPVAGHGNFQPLTPYVGSLLVLATFASVISAVLLGNRHLPLLSTSHVGYRHLLTLVISALSFISILVSSVWWVSVGANSMVTSSHQAKLPAYISASGETPSRYKTLVITSQKNSITYFIARDKSLELGDADPLYDVDARVNEAVGDLVTGVGVASSQVLGNFGIKYLFLSQPIDQDLVRTIDGIGGFTRSAATKDGISWKITNARTRISLTFADASTLEVASGDIGAKTIAPSKGTLVIAEKFDGKWKLLFNGRSLPIEKSPEGYPAFSIPEKGVIQIFHDGTQRRALISLQFIFILTLIILASPRGRRRREVPIEELA